MTPEDTLLDNTVERYWRDLYNKNPEFDGSNRSNLRGLEERRRIVLGVLKAGLTGHTVLEVGAGRGFYSDRMREWGYEVRTTDIAVGDCYYDVTKGVQGSQFDNVVAMSVLPHILDRESVIAAIRNIKAMALERIIISAQIRWLMGKKGRNIRMWPAGIYRGLGKLLEEVAIPPGTALVMVFDAN